MRPLTCCPNASLIHLFVRRYFLEEKAAGLSFSISLPTFGSPSPSPGSQSGSLAAEAGRGQAEARKTAAAEQAAAAERKRKEIALAEQRQLKAKERNAAAVVAQKKRIEDEKRKSAAAKSAEQRQKSAAEEKRTAAAAAEQRKKQAEENRAAAATASEQKRNEAEEKRAAAAAARQQQQEAAAAAKQKTASVISASKTPSKPKMAAPPRGVPIVRSWKKRADGTSTSHSKLTFLQPEANILRCLSSKGGVSGRIYNSKNFEDGDFIETSPITKGSLSDGSLVQTSSGSRYFLSPEAAVKKANIRAAIKDMTAAQPGSTITLTKQRKDFEAKKAMDAVEKAKPRATFSLFGLAFGDTDEGLPPAEKPKPAATPVKTAPRGVPTFTRFRKNGDGSITGIISGSPNFTDGDRVTTSTITSGKVEKYEVVVTGSGSRYFLS
jgi:chemotaxis protein histidine kinase CheA